MSEILRHMLINHLINTLQRDIKILLCFVLLCLLGPHLQHMEAPRLGVKSELQLPASTTATVMPDLSHLCDLHHSSQQHRLLNPLSGARGGTHNFMDTGQVLYHWATIGTPKYWFSKTASPYDIPIDLQIWCLLSFLFRLQAIINIRTYLLKA